MQPKLKAFFLPKTTQSPARTSPRSPPRNDRSQGSGTRQSTQLKISLRPPQLEEPSRTGTRVSLQLPQLEESSLTGARLSLQLPQLEESSLTGARLSLQPPQLGMASSPGLGEIPQTPQLSRPKLGESPQTPQSSRPVSPQPPQLEEQSNSGLRLSLRPPQLVTSLQPPQKEEQGMSRQGSLLQPPQAACTPAQRAENKPTLVESRLAKALWANDKMNPIQKNATKTPTQPSRIRKSRKIHLLQQKFNDLCNRSAPANNSQPKNKVIPPLQRNIEYFSHNGPVHKMGHF